MVPRRLKAIYYAILSPLMRLNALRYRTMPYGGRRGRRYVHLGPGQNNYLQGWINVDANLLSSKPDIWSDLRYKLPFPDQSVDAIYSHHVIEHLPDLDFHFQEMFRCLMPGGVIRVGGPHGDNAMRAMLEEDYEWFGDWPISRSSIGGRFENFIFFKGEHLTILTESFMLELANEAGFCDVQVVLPRVTNHTKMIDDSIFLLEEKVGERLPRTVMIEARKP